MYNKDTLVYSK